METFRKKVQWVILDNKSSMVLLIYMHILHGIYIYSSVDQTVLWYYHGTYPKIQETCCHVQKDMTLPWYIFVTLKIYQKVL